MAREEEKRFRARWRPRGREETGTGGEGGEEEEKGEEGVEARVRRR